MSQHAVRVSVVDRFRDPLHAELAPLAPRIDQEGLYPTEFLHRFGDAGGFGVCIPTRFGGLGGRLAEQVEVNAAVGAECGSTAFIVWCQAVSAWYLLHAPNAEVRQKYLARVTRGELFSGSGMSNAVKHLAGIEKIYLQAHRVADGYRVNGFLPWVSNLGADHLLIAAAEVDDGGYLMFATPCDAEGLELHACPDFAGMEGTRTLNLRFHDLTVPADAVIAHPGQFAAYMASIKPGFILGQVGMGLGVTEGSLRTIHKYNGTHAHVNVYLDDQEDEIQTELDDLKIRAAELSVATEAGAVDVLDVLRLREATSSLALRAANSAMLHAGARGYLMSNPAQRRLREAVFVSIVTPALKHLRKEIHDLEASRSADAAPRIAAVA